MARIKVQGFLITLASIISLLTACSAPYDLVRPDSPDQVVGKCEFLPLHFEGNGIILRADSIARLKSIAVCIKNAQRPVRIAGHTDRMGSDAYRKKLGKLRAMEVRKHLMRWGVMDALMTTYSYGRARMVCRGDYKRCAPMNRRVELSFQ